MKNSVPFEHITGLRLMGVLPLSIYFDEHNALKVNSSIFNQRGTMAVVIVGNKYSVIEPGWDSNFDRNGLEIVDDDLNSIFQVDRRAEDVIRIAGVLTTSQGMTVLANDQGWTVNPGKLTESLDPKRIFKYPRKEHQHERVSP
jgi:hypothetical protein